MVANCRALAEMIRGNLTLFPDEDIQEKSFLLQ
jgi:hypothetical protein